MTLGPYLGLMMSLSGYVAFDYQQNTQNTMADTDCRHAECKCKLSTSKPEAKRVFQASVIRARTALPPRKTDNCAGSETHDHLY